MLKTIPSIISPEMMRILMEMGHGDEICITDGNFPAQQVGRRVVRSDGHNVAEILSAILKYFPLDTFAEGSVILMDYEKVRTDRPRIWETYRGIIDASEESSAFTDFSLIDRYEFYERAGKCFAVIATGEKEIYANIILRKGIV